MYDQNELYQFFLDKTPLVENVYRQYSVEYTK